MIWRDSTSGFSPLSTWVMTQTTIIAEEEIKLILAGPDIEGRPIHVDNFLRLGRRTEGYYGLT